MRKNNIPSIQTRGHSGETGGRGRVSAKPLREHLEIPDHKLLRRIGQGAYGEVWLAQNVMGTQRAVKVVYRDAFESDRPYEREFKGIQKFEPISRTHESHVDILHVGRNDKAGYFFYVMELADDANAKGGEQNSEVTRRRSDAGDQRPEDGGQGAGTEDPILERQSSVLIDWKAYEPRTIKSDLARRRVPYEECLEISLALTTALNHLHRGGLVHRDIKPSNIIFVNDLPKLADIGLVAETGKTLSFVGTEGYLPPEGPGSVQADIFSLGKTLYEIATGKDRQEFPEMPTRIDQSAERERLFEFNEVLAKACHPDVMKRYSTAAEMREDLVLLRAGKSVRRSRTLERRLALLTRASLTGMALTGVVVAGYLYQQSQTREARRLAGENRELAEQNLQLAQVEAEQRARVEQSLRHLEQEKIERKFGTGESGQALTQLAEQIRLNPADPVVGRRLLSALTYRNFALPIGTASVEQEITSIDVSPDGHLFATGTADGEVTLWHLPGFQRLASFHHTRRVGSIEFSQEGGLLLTASDDGTAAVLDPRRELLMLLTLRHEAGVNDAAFSPDNAWILTGADNRRATVWNGATGEKVFSLEHTERKVGEVHFTPDGRRLITLGGRDELKVWDTATGTLLRAREDLRVGSPYGLCDRLVITPDSARVAVMNSRQSSRLRLWDFQADIVFVSSQTHRWPMTGLDISPDGLRAVSGSNDQSIRWWRVSDASVTMAPIYHGGAVAFVKFSPNGAMVASSSRTGTVRLWDGFSGESIAEPLRHPDIVHYIAFSPNGKTLLTASEHAIWLWDIRPGQARPLTLDHASNEAEKWFVNAEFLGDGKRVVTTSRLSVRARTWTPWSLVGGLSPGYARVWDVKSGGALTPPMPHSRALDAPPAYDTVSGRLLTGGFDGTARIWQATTGQLLGEFKPHADKYNYGTYLFAGGETALTTAGAGPPSLWRTDDGEVLRRFDPGAATWGFAVSGDETLVAVHCQDNRTAVFEIATGTLLFETGGGKARIGRDAELIAVKVDNSVIQLVNARTGASIHDPLRHEEVEGAVFSNDGRFLATYSLDQSAKVWDVTTGTMASRRLDHDWMVVDAAFSPDNAKLATAAWDKTTRIWDIDTGLPISEPLRHHDSVFGVDYSPTGDWLVTSTKEGHARLWEVIEFSGSVPGWVAEIAEFLATPEGSVRDSYQCFMQIKQEVLSEEGDDFFTRWGRWFFGDRDRRMISPSSEVDMNRYLDRRLEEDTLVQGSALQEALSCDPMNPYYLARLGRKYTVRRFQHDFVIDFEKAHWFTRSAVQFDPDLPTAWWARAEVLLAEGMLEEAEAAVNRAIELDAGDPNGWYIHSRIRVARDDDEGAFRSFCEALDQTLARSSEQAWKWKGYLNERLLPYRSELLGSDARSRLLRIARWWERHPDGPNGKEAEWLNSYAVRASTASSD